MDDAVRDYIEAIGPANRPLFDRLDGLVRETTPGAKVVISYGILAYVVGGSRLFIGAWKHGLSLYGWHQGADGGFISRYPHLKHGKATLHLSPENAATIPDSDFGALFRATLAG